MGMTILEKILSRASGRPKISPGDIAVVDIDLSVLIDTDFFPTYWRAARQVADASKIVVIFDHRVPAPDRETAEAHLIGRKFVKQFGIKRFHDAGREQGISHVIVGDYGYALPGTVLLCEDSHACAAGAYNCASRGVGLPDMIYGVTTGRTWFRVGETIRYDFVGALAAHASAKDVFLHIAGLYGDHTNQNVEYGGSGLASLNMNARRTISTMSAELSAEFATFEPDEILLDHIRKHAEPGAKFEPTYPDADARYKARRTIVLDEIKPLLALPDAVVNNSVAVEDAAGEVIHQAFIGSCANGSLDDLAVAARILDGRRVAPGVRLIVTPASQEIYRQALAAGYVSIMVEAGATVTNATCGACGGGHLGIIGPGETCITASTRNYKGRMGDPSARIFMASPATVAASAVAGVITHPDGPFAGDISC